MKLKSGEVFLIVFIIIVIILGIMCFMIQRGRSMQQNIPSSNTGIPSSTSTALSAPSFLSGMKLTFDEEFNTLSLYTLNGNTACGPGGTGIWQTVLYFCSRTITSNNEAEIYTDPTFLNYYQKKSTTTLTSVDPFSINDGILTIKAAPIDPTIRAAVGPWAKYTSGFLSTEYSFSQTYGYFEMRAELPSGAGLWPAFWLLPVDKSWPPEIDALETFGAKNPANGQGGSTLIHYASHTTNTLQSCGAWYNVGVDVTQGFHTYGVDWEPTGITYYFDGKPYVTCPPNPQANKPFYILVNLAVGGPGSWPGTPNASNTWAAEMKIDYIRAYQKIQ